MISKIFALIKTNNIEENLFLNIQNSLKYKDFNDEFTYEIDLIFNNFNFSNAEETYVIWDKYKADRFQTNWLLLNWKYVWYSMRDEAVILYQEKLNRLLLITHYGRIYFNSFNNN